MGMFDNETQIYELQDQVSRVEKLLSWVVTKMGGSPADITRIDRRTPPAGFTAVP